MAFDPTCAHVIVGNSRYQVLKPQEYGKRPKLDGEGNMIPIMAPAQQKVNPPVLVLDEEGEPVLDGDSNPVFTDPTPAVDDAGEPVMEAPLQAVDGQGNPLFELEDYALPREWDEAATMALVNRDHPPELPPVEQEPTYDDVSE